MYCVHHHWHNNRLTVLCASKHYHCTYSSSPFQFLSVPYNSFTLPVMFCCRGSGSTNLIGDRGTSESRRKHFTSRDCCRVSAANEEQVCSYYEVCVFAAYVTVETTRELLLVSVAHAFGMVGHAIAAKCGKYEKEVKAYVLCWKSLRCELGFEPHRAQGYGCFWRQPYALFASLGTAVLSRTYCSRSGLVAAFMLSVFSSIFAPGS